MGCFPLDNEPYHSLSDSQKKVIGIRSLTEFGNSLRAPSSISALPPILHLLRLALKLFRREPAISMFDWLFTPTHTSSPHFQHTWVRASSQYYLAFTLDMGRSHGFGSTTTYYTPYSDSLSLRLRIFHLTLHVLVTRGSILHQERLYSLPDFDSV